MTCPSLPTMASRDMPALVRSAMRGLKSLNHRNVIRQAPRAHRKSCHVKVVVGATSKTPPRSDRQPEPEDGEARDEEFGQNQEHAEDDPVPVFGLQSMVSSCCG